MQLSNQEQAVISKAMGHIIAGMTPPGRILDSRGRPMARSASYTYRRDAAKRTGTMRNWVPQRLVGRQSQAMERERIVERSIDLVNNDPHAAGIVDAISTTEIGSGLIPHPTLDAEILGLEKEEARKLQAQQRAVYAEWLPFADAGGRMDFGQIQFLVKRNLLQYGEYLVLIQMIKDPWRPFSLACQVINPLRLRTPSDKVTDGNITDGVELGKYGQPKAYWIKKADPNAHMKADTSKNFMRIPAKKGHRCLVLHGFVSNDPEQVRGMPFFAPAMKYFKDFNDLLDAELVSNIVTAALSYFIEVGGGTDPDGVLDWMTDISDETTNADGDTKNIRYTETYPGQILYGNAGEKPHLLSANRPGTTFDPFVKTIKKSIATSINLPYPVIFKDVEGVNYAGFRSAMLDAWRVFMADREIFGRGFCQPIHSMLQEEAWLRGRLPGIRDFYSQMYHYTRTRWSGSPKGDIEPVKAAQANILLKNNRLKTHQSIISELGEGEVRDVFEALEEEENLLAAKGLTVKDSGMGATAADGYSVEKEEKEENKDDES